MRILLSAIMQDCGKIKYCRLLNINHLHYVVPVSYTHLDVYKRQVREIPAVMHVRTAGVSMHSGLKPIVYMFRMTVSILTVWIREKILKMDEDKIRELEKYNE